MKLCSITYNGSFCVDDVSFDSADSAYLKFREIFNKSLGKNTYGRFGIRKLRKERIPDTGIVFSEEYRVYLENKFSDASPLRAYIIGMIGPSYCKIFSPEQDGEDYLDWCLCRGSKMLRLYERQKHTGATSSSYKLFRYGKKR